MKKNNGNGSDKNNYNKSFSSETKSEPLDKTSRSHKYVKDEEAIIKTIFESIPKESQITLARFEGPNIALYTKNPRFSLTELTYYLSSLSKNLKKRFVVRTDQSIRLQEDETRSIVSRILPKEVIVSALFCDEATGEVVLEVNKPESVISETIISIAEATGWIAHLRRSPHIPSMSIKNIHTILKSSSKERSNFLRELGNRVFRDPIIKKEDENQEKENIPQKALVNDKQNKNWNNKEVYIFCLGGVKQVGRSCFIVMTSESKIMLDCGINPGENNAIDAYPRIDWFDFKLEDLDAIVISHAHIDHQGFLPTLFKYGYDGPVYCTEPTLPLMNLLQLDSVKISQNNGVYCPYEIRDINEIIKHCITLPYGKPTDISPDTTITLNNAGHIMGSATVHLNISGAHNILYSGDYKYAKTQLLDSAVSNYPRVETLITES
ncbi:MAG TPA: MBL fold metallo-hydrolase, partial [Nitrososphaeraceae archaeon]